MARVYRGEPLGEVPGIRLEDERDQISIVDFGHRPREHLIAGCHCTPPSPPPLRYAMCSSARHLRGTLKARGMACPLACSAPSEEHGPRPAKAGAAVAQVRDCADDGMDGPALPVLPSPAHAAGVALYRDDID